MLVSLMRQKYPLVQTLVHSSLLLLKINKPHLYRLGYRDMASLIPHETQIKPKDSMSEIGLLLFGNDGDDQLSVTFTLF